MRSTGKNFKRSIALVLALCLCLISAAPAFAAGTGQTENNQEQVIEEAELLDASLVAGEAVIGVTAAGRRSLPVALAQTDIVLNDLMDVSDGVSAMSASEKQSLLGSSDSIDTCILMAAQSPTISTEELIALLSACDGVLFAEENTTVSLSETETTEFTESIETTETTETASADDTAAESSDYDSTQTEAEADVLSGTQVSVELPEETYTEEKSTPIYKKFQWFLENLGFSDGKSGVDLNIGNAHGSKDTVIAVMDSGIDYNHPDLNDRMIRLTDSKYKNIRTETKCGVYGYNAVDAASGKIYSEPMDGYNHGTHCAGIIAAEGEKVSGVMDNATLVAVKVADAEGHANFIPIILGFQWILQAKETYGVNIAAVNFSIGSAQSKLCYKLSIAELDANGITFFKAAGNQGTNMDTTEYDNLEVADSTIVVDALNADGSVGFYSNYGNSTDVLAPGTNILSTGTEEDDKGRKFYAFEAAENGKALAYTGFEYKKEDTTKENLKFSVDASQNELVEVSTEHHMTGNYSLNIKNSTSSTVTLTSDKITLTPTEDVYFNLSCQDFVQNYVIVSLKVTNTDGTNPRFEKYALCVGLDRDGVHEGVDAWHETDIFDYGSFAKKAKAAIEKDPSGNYTVGSFLSGNAVKTLDVWAAANNYTIDWANFQVQLEIGSTSARVSQIGETIDIDQTAGPTGTLYLDDIGFGTEPDYYTLETGTSMAAPAVTGIYGLVYSQYGDKECNDKLSARITGSVKSDEQYKNVCLTRGIVDATAALNADESTFNPVLQSASMSGDVLTIYGWFLGEEGKEKGKVTVNGTDAKILSFTQDEKDDTKDGYADVCGTLSVQIPLGISGEQVVEYTAASGKTGRIYTDVSPITTHFDDMTGSDSSVFANTHSASMIEGSSGPEIYTKEIDNNTQQLLAYDAVSGSWKNKCTISAYPWETSNISIAYLNDTYYALSTNSSSSQQLYKLIEENGTGHWQAIGSPINNQVLSLLTAAEGQLYIIGGLKAYSRDAKQVTTISRAVIGENDSVTIETLCNNSKITADMGSTAAVKNGILYFMNYDDAAKNGLFAFNLTDHSLTDYPLPVTTEKPVNSGYGLSAFRDGLIFTAKFNSTNNNTWFFDTETGSWNASDLCLDSALSQVYDGATVGHTAYVLGKSRNDSFWFVRTLDFEADEDDGQRVTWIMGSEEDAVFRIDISYAFFGGKVKMDGEPLGTDNYTVASGSTVITLKNAYLKTLSAGEHTLIAYFNVNGKEVAVPCTLNILEAEKANVATGISGSDSGMTTAIALILLAAALGSVLFLRRRRS